MPGTRVETDWQAGHPIVFSGEWKGKSFEDHGEIRSIVEGEHVTFTHWSGARPQPEDYHLVRYALTQENGNTRVRLTQSNVGSTPDVDEQTRAEFTRTFQMMLDQLKRTAET